MCHYLVHELGHKQPKTTMELLNIATQHVSGDEAVRAAFTLAKAGAAIGGGQTTPPISQSEAPRRVLRVERRCNTHFLQE
jgi:hypothetical protein